jgi:hypothetical protein
MIKPHYYIAFAAAWSIGNGILHDIFVLRERKPFDRDLIRLLIDGHILIFSGVFYLVCFDAIKNQQQWAIWISLTTAAFLLGYCGLIFKLLPSIGTIIINAIAALWLISQINW